MKVLYLTNIPSPYRVNYFNELGKKCELTVLFETDSSTERDDSWKNFHFENFRGIIMRGVRTGMDTAFCPSVIRYLKRGEYDWIVTTVLASLTGQLAAAWMRLRNIPYCYEGDGGAAGETGGIKARLKRAVIAPARLCFSTSAMFDQYCTTYGAARERIRRYPFSSVYKKDVLTAVMPEEEKSRLKNQLGISEDKMILSVGRIVRLKGYDVLLNVLAEMGNDAWGIYIIGGEAGGEFLNIVAEKKIKNVHFLPFMQWEDLKKYYEAADLFVLPTRYDPWGLVINEAMATGLPVITTYTCGAGTEMVQNGENGFLYQAEDAGALKKYLIELMESPVLRREMSKNALSTAEHYTIEEMAEVHYLTFCGKFAHEGNRL